MSQRTNKISGLGELAVMALRDKLLAMTLSELKAYLKKNTSDELRWLIDTYSQTEDDELCRAAKELMIERLESIKNFQRGATVLRLERIFESGLLQNPENIGLIHYKSVFVECIIELHFLLSVYDRIAKKIAFKEDITPFNDPKQKNSYDNVVSLIEFIRHAICHSDDLAKRRNITDNHVAYSFQFGIKTPPVGSLPHLCKYEDDIACIFGSHLIYINRHLERIFIALKDKVYERSEQAAFKQLSELRRQEKHM